MSWGFWDCLLRENILAATNGKLNHKLLQEFFAVTNRYLQHEPLKICSLIPQQNPKKKKNRDFEMKIEFTWWSKTGWERALNSVVVEQNKMTEMRYVSCFVCTISSLTQQNRSWNRMWRRKRLFKRQCANFIYIYVYRRLYIFFISTKIWIRVGFFLFSA